MKPKVGQSKQDFISSFMEQMKDEYPDEKQRIAVAESTWEQSLFKIAKSVDESQLVMGWANVSVNADGSIPFDWQDDVIPIEVLEKAAINFMMDYRGSGEVHMGESKGVVVESIVFTKEKQRIMGIPEGCVPEGWFITVKLFDADVFAKVKSGEYKMFSIQGKAVRRRY